MSPKHVWVLVAAAMCVGAAPSPPADVTTEMSWCRVGIDSECTGEGDLASRCFNNKCMCSSGYINPTGDNVAGNCVKASEVNGYWSRTTKVRVDLTFANSSCAGFGSNAKVEFQKQFIKALQTYGGVYTMSLKYMYGCENSEVVAAVYIADMRHTTFAAMKHVIDALMTNIAADANLNDILGDSLAAAATKSPAGLVECILHGADVTVKIERNCQAMSCQSTYNIKTYDSLTSCKEKDSTTKKVGRIVGIVVGSVVGVIVVAAFVYLIYTRKNIKKSNKRPRRHSRADVENGGKAKAAKDAPSAKDGSKQPATQGQEMTLQQNPKEAAEEAPPF